MDDADGLRHSLTVSEIVERWPTLFHMAEADSWLSVERHGLLSTTALLDLFEVTGDEREAIESARRSESVTIHHPVHGTVVIRDNKPINELALRRTLVGMTEVEWYRTLNGRVYFWLSKRRMDKLREAKAYRDRRHDILTIDTTALLAHYATRVELSALNSGAVHPAANVPRGVETFRPIAGFPWSQRLKVNRAEPIVELTIPYAVPDIARYVINVSTH
ncbi:MAG TPA: hypothetical protein VII96_11385 [Acidimicrobiales bacterium]